MDWSFQRHTKLQTARLPAVHTFMSSATKQEIALAFYSAMLFAHLFIAKMSIQQIRIVFGGNLHLSDCDKHAATMPPLQLVM